MIKIRPFKAEDAKETYQLFYETVHAINAKDYSKSQLEVWAPKDKNIEDWCASLLNNYSFVAIDTLTNQILGFADLKENGCLERGYVHKEFQGQGIGQMLLDIRVEKAKSLGLEKIFSDVSITAKPFFEHNQFILIKKQVKVLGTVHFIQYRMEKPLIRNKK